MESNISSVRFDIHGSSKSNSNKYIASMMMGRTMMIESIYDDPTGKKLTINANSSKEVVHDSAGEADYRTGAYAAYIFPSFSYKDSVVMTIYEYISFSSNTGPILGFYSGTGHFAVSGINRVDTAQIGDDKNGNIYLANTNSSSGSINLASPNECHATFIALKPMVVYQDPRDSTSYSYRNQINDYFINASTE